MKKVYFFVDKLTLGIRRPCVRSLASRNPTGILLNRYYNILSSPAKFRFYRRYSGLFLKHALLFPNTWTVFFSGHKIIMPLRMPSAGLDWGLALSILGHDDEVKATYAALVSSDQRPELFLDVGANYGTHSVLFLSVGIPTISFEPNPLCLSQFQAMCELNGLKGRWEQVAIGNGNGEIELVYQEAATWSGSVSSAKALIIKRSPTAKTKLVPIKKLDDYLSDVCCDRVLIKIDVEGFESEVIRGAAILIAARKPKIIFECDNLDRRPELFNLLTDLGYSIYMLPWRPARGSRLLDRSEFLKSAAGNFIAIMGTD